MAISFKHFAIEEDHMMAMGPLAGPMDLTLGNDWHDEVNDQLAEALEAPLLSPAIGYGRVYLVMARHNLALPLLGHPLDSLHDEHVYIIETPQPWFLYVAYAQDDRGLYEFHAEIMDEQTLTDFLSSTEDEDETLDR